MPLAPAAGQIARPQLHAGLAALSCMPRPCQDLFHAQMSHGQLCSTMLEMRDYIGHVQLAGVPGRHEPDADGEVNWPFVLNILQRDVGWV